MTTANIFVADANSLDPLAADAESAGVFSISGDFETYSRRITTQYGNLVDFATSSYLGLESDDTIIAHVHNTLRSQGLGRTASPLYFRSTAMECVARTIARITNLPNVLLFSSGTLANYAALRYGVPRNIQVLLDRHCHRSLMDASRSRPGRRFKGDLMLPSRHPAHPIHKARSERLAFVCDSVYSMSGLRANLTALAQLSASHDAYLVIDDSHAFGILGSDGAGSSECCKNVSRNRLIITGSLSKLGIGMGGFVACSAEIAARMRNSAPQYGFSCAMPPVSASIAKEIVEMIGTARWQNAIIRLHHNWCAVVGGLKSGGWCPMSSTFAPFVVLRLSGEQHMRAVCNSLVNSHIAFNVVGFPAIPRGEYRIRLCLSAAHSTHDNELLVSSLAGWQVT